MGAMEEFQDVVLKVVKNIDEIVTDKNLIEAIDRSATGMFCNDRIDTSHELVILNIILSKAARQCKEVINSIELYCEHCGYKGCVVCGRESEDLIQIIKDAQRNAMEANEMSIDATSKPMFGGVASVAME